MKIVHFADLHIGVENYSKTDPESGLSSRLLDFLKSFDFVTNYIINPKNKIDAVIFSGDAFKTREPSPTHVREFAKRIKKITSYQIPVILLIGNHDLPSVSKKANTLDIFSTLEVPGVYLIKKSKIIEVKIKDQVLQVAGFPWMNKTELLDSTNSKNLTISETGELVSKNIKKIILDLSKKTKDKKAILAAHISVAGAKYSSEQEIMLGSDLAIKLADLLNTNFRYIALGHIHKYQVLSEKPLIIYPGSIERIDFGEEKEKKGFVVVDLPFDPKQKVTYKFIETPARKFVTLEVKISYNEKSPTKKVLHEIGKYDLSQAICKIKIQGPQEKIDILEKSQIQEALSGAFLVVSIIIDIEDRFTSQELPYFEKSLSILDMVGEYCKNKKLSKEKLRLIKKYAKILIEESIKE